MNYNMLKSVVLAKYFTIQAFADDIQWTRNKASRIVNGVSEPSLDDIVEITNIMEFDEITFFAIFFNSLSTMCTA